MGSRCGGRRFWRRRRQRWRRAASSWLILCSSRRQRIARPKRMRMSGGIACDCRRVHPMMSHIALGPCSGLTCPTSTLPRLWLRRHWFLRTSGAQAPSHLDSYRSAEALRHRKSKSEASCARWTAEGGCPHMIIPTRSLDGVLIKEWRI